MVRKDQLRYWKSPYNWVVYLKILTRENLFYVNQWDVGINQNTPSNSPNAPDTKLEFKKERGPSRAIIQKCAPHERSPCAPKFEERPHDETLQQERCARKAPGDLAKNIHKLKNSDKTAFFLFLVQQK